MGHPVLLRGSAFLHLPLPGARTAASSAAFGKNRLPCGAGAQLPAGYRRNQSASAASGAGSFGKLWHRHCPGARRSGDTSHPDAYRGHALICECGQLLADCTGSTAGENIHALESFCVARDLDCDILNACRRFASCTPANILLTESDGKRV